jgi:hypothetical protein
VILPDFDQGAFRQAGVCQQFNRVLKRHHVIGSGVKNLVRSAA